MRKRVLLALVLVLTLLVSTGCSLIIKDEEVDKQTPIIEVAGKTITKGEVQDMTQSVLDYNELPDPVESAEEAVANLEEAVDLLMSVVKELKSLQSAEVE